MTVRRFRNRAGSSALLSPRRSAWLAAVKLPALAPVRVIEDGAVRTVVEALFGYEDSYLVLRYKLPRQGAEIEIEARVHWNEKDRMLKLSLPGLDAQRAPARPGGLWRGKPAGQRRRGGGAEVAGAGLRRAGADA